MLKIPTRAFTKLGHDNVAVAKEVNIKIDMRTRLQ